MAKTLRVIDPFFIMELGDSFEFDPESKMYVSNHNEEFYKTDDGNINDIKSSYHSSFSISPEYAQSLIEDGYLEEVQDKNKDFVNIFDEIERLIVKYNKGLETLEEDCAELPACVKVEKETVLRNLISVLEHLKGLKK